MLLTASNLRHLRAQLIQWRQAGDSIAFVPTMGALHQGHRALIETAKKSAKRTAVSIFVNPLQFGPNEDLSKYPRNPEADKKLLEEVGADLLYMPSVADMYPEGFGTQIDPGPLAKILEGEHRPGHFQGVATVVVKLLLQVLPDMAFFGDKDYQQLLILHHVARDLDLPVYIQAVPIVRDADGLAFSSRNAYLSAAERERAVTLPDTLQDCAKKIRDGKDISETLKEGRAALEKAGFKVDYLELRHAHTLMPVSDNKGSDNKAPMRLLAAARMGTTRLIDNLAV